MGMLGPAGFIGGLFLIQSDFYGCVAWLPSRHKSVHLPSAVGEEQKAINRLDQCQ